MRPLLLLSVLSIVHAAAATTAPAPPPAADLVLHGGKVITVDAADRIAQAIAVRGERIVAVGSDAEVLALAGPGTRTVDLRGRTVTPGLIDAHNHFQDGALVRYERIDLGYPAVGSVIDAQRLVAERASRAASGEWVIGSGWDEGKLAEKRYIRASDLDAVAGDHPVWLEHTSGHYGVANSAALRMAGIGRETPDPPFGTIDRDPDGAPTGVLKESAMRAVNALLPDYTPAQRENAVARFAREFGAECMTAAKEPGIDESAWNTYRTVEARGELPVRIFVLWDGGTTLEEARALIARRAASTRPYGNGGNDNLISGGVKLYMDGSGGARTAWLRAPWNRNRTEVDGNNTGYPASDPEVLRRMIALYHEAGMHVSVHAIGDRAIDETVDSYAAALAAHPVKGLRHGIIHANIPSDHALATMARLQREFDAAFPEPSATFTWYLGDVYAANFGDRARRLNPLASYQRMGIRWANGSDFSVTPFPARYGIWAAVARQTLLDAPGDPFGRAEAVDVRAALRAVTIWAAHQLFLDDRTGSIEVGKYADLAVWDRDPYTVPTAALKDMRCEMTVFSGKTVYGKL
ncbi:MAG: amidohydrolase [Gammaproteobacteria bacterium]